MHLLIVTRRVDELGEFARALAAKTSLDLRFTDGWSNALAIARDMPPALVVIDEGLENGPALDLAKKLLTVNPMINVAAVSVFEGEKFHAYSEGLGLLAAVPEHPTAADAAPLAEAFLRLFPAN